MGSMCHSCDAIRCNPNSNIDLYYFRIRLYSTKTLKSLGTLAYHKEGCQAVAFACSLREDTAPVESEEDTDEDDMGAVEKEVRSRWLAAGGKDSRVSIWEMISFRDDKG